jgi:flavin reductase (DIM6/NTAB) family NADH-FMN oxidoreductase RutF
MKKEKLSFRDVMSLVPTSVSILSCIQNSLIYGCTISSLVSVNIDEKSPEIIFVLKNDSLIGKNIRLGNLFTINVLASSQICLAKKYSKERDPDLLSEKTWDISDGFAKIKDARVHLGCKLAKVYDSHAANIFVGSVEKYFGESYQSALVYEARDYGRLIH